jgi:hypothetical protein
MKLGFSRQIFGKYSNIKFHEILSNGSLIVSCGWTDRETDITKPIVGSPKFAKTPKNGPPLPWNNDQNSHLRLLHWGNKISKATVLQWIPSPHPPEGYHGYSRAVFVVGPAGPTTNTARLSSRYEGKTRGCYCSHWARDDGRENARNMLSCKQTSG